MTTRRLELPTADGVCDADVFYPDGGGPFPGVLMFMDAFGPRVYLRGMAADLASRGYYVLLPNLFYRTRRAPVLDAVFPLAPADMPAAFKQLMPYFQNFSPEAAMRDVDACIDFLDHQSQVRKGPLGTTGYCMGGAVAIRTAARHPDRIAAAASFHAGNLATEAPNSPHRLLPQVRAELYIAHADQDTSMPPEQMQRLKDALKTAGLRHEVELYAGAKHGFTMADLPAGDPESIRRHWEKLEALLKRNL